MRIKGQIYSLKPWAKALVDLLTFYPSAKADGN